MEAGGKDCEDETLQTAFKKLRVDAESLPGVSVEVSRSGPEASGAKPKLSCSKDNWHGCMRKTSRGASRTQRRRRSKSPVLQPPKFSYCGSVSPPSGCLKHQRLATTTTATTTSSSPGPTLGPALAQKELSSVGTAGSISPLVFGSSPSPQPPTSHQKIPAAVITKKGVSRCGEGEERRSLEPSACDEAKPLICAGADASDFRALSELHGTSSIAPPSSSETTPLACSCAWVQNASDAPKEEAENDVEKGPELPCTCHQPNQASWPGVEVYSFTGLRGAISECERNLPPTQEDTSRTLASSNANANANAATSPNVNVTAASASATNARSCSEQARVSYVDDITIEDLSGYMEYYLYMPKKMSHMAEMMYT